MSDMAASALAQLIATCVDYRGLPDQPMTLAENIEATLLTNPGVVCSALMKANENTIDNLYRLLGAHWVAGTAGYWTTDPFLRGNV